MALAEENVSRLRELREYVATLGDDQYQWHAGANAGSIGAQVRHIMEHYQALLATRSVLDYDARPRDQHLERCRATAQRGLARLEHDLLGFARNQPADRGFRVRVTVSHDNSFERPEFESSMARELAFLASHTVHHLAVIGLLGRLQGHPTPADFGVATSTLHFRRTCEQSEDHERCVR